MKNPYLNALLAAVYIALVAAFTQYVPSHLAPKMGVLGNVAFICLVTFSVALMGYFFAFQPLKMYIDGDKQGAVRLFGRTLASFAAITAVVFIALFVVYRPSAGAPVADVTYTCDKGHSIHALLYNGPAAPAPQPGEMPRPTGTAVVTLDGASPVTLKQTISADGVRYSNGDPQVKQGEPGAETLVFWSKGNTALIMRENAMDTAYTNCSTPTP